MPQDYTLIKRNTWSWLFKQNNLTNIVTQPSKPKKEIKVVKKTNGLHRYVDEFPGYPPEHKEFNQYYAEKGEKLVSKLLSL